MEAFDGTEPSSTDRGVDVPGQEMQQAAELLEHFDAGELDGFLKGLVERAAAHAPKPVTHMLASLLGRAARQLLPHDGSSVVTRAARAFGLELEGLSAEDQAFEVARRFVRFANDAASRTAKASPHQAPWTAARLAAATAARTHAPGLVVSTQGGGPPSGFWFRRGRQLIVLDP